MDVLVVPPHARLGETVAVLRDAAEVYGWSIEVEAAEDREDGAARVRVVPGTCTRQPEALRVLERARSCHAALVDGVAAERTPQRGIPVSR